MELNLNRKIIKVNFEGESYSVRAPSNAELKQFIDSGADGLEQTILLLEKLGLPAAIAWELDAESLGNVVEAITPKKKN